MTYTSTSDLSNGNQVSSNLDAYKTISKKAQSNISYRVILDEGVPRGVGLWGRFVLFLKYLGNTQEAKRVNGAVREHFKKAIEDAYGASIADAAEHDIYLNKQKSLRARDVARTLLSVNQKLNDNKDNETPVYLKNNDDLQSSQTSPNSLDFTNTIDNTSLSINNQADVSSSETTNNTTVDPFTNTTGNTSSPIIEQEHEDNLTTKKNNNDTVKVTSSESGNYTEVHKLAYEKVEVSKIDKIETIQSKRQEPKNKEKECIIDMLALDDSNDDLSGMNLMNQYLKDDTKQESMFDGLVESSTKAFEMLDNAKPSFTTQQRLYDTDKCFTVCKNIPDKDEKKSSLELNHYQIKNAKRLLYIMADKSEEEYICIPPTKICKKLSLTIDNEESDRTSTFNKENVVSNKTAEYTLAGEFILTEENYIGWTDDEHTALRICTHLSNPDYSLLSFINKSAMINETWNSTSCIIETAINALSKITVNSTPAYFFSIVHNGELLNPKEFSPSVLAQPMTDALQQHIKNGTAQTYFENEKGHEVIHNGFSVISDMDMNSDKVHELKNNPNAILFQFQSKFGKRIQVTKGGVKKSFMVFTPGSKFKLTNVVRQQVFHKQEHKHKSKGLNRNKQVVTRPMGYEPGALVLIYQQLNT